MYLCTTSTSQDNFREYHITLLPVPSGFELFNSTPWVVHTLPDIEFAVAKLRQVTENIFKPEEHVQSLKKVVRQLKKHNLLLKFPKLHVQSLHIRAYSDTSHANNDDLSSQIEFVGTLWYDNCTIIGFGSYECKRKTPSTIDSEWHALADAYGYAFMLKKDMEALLADVVPIQLFTDSQTIFKVIVRATTTTERRLMTDAQETREAYEKE